MASADKKRQKSSGKRSTRVNPGSKSSSTSRSSSSASTSSSEHGSVRDQTPPKGRSSHDDRGEAIGGREAEFIGMGLIGLGAVIGLATYFDLAGILGDGIEALVGWFIGMGRFVLPLAVVFAGIALIRKGRSSSPVQLVLGWGLMSAAGLGIVHIVRFDNDASGFDKYADWGGWIGAAVGYPLRAILGDIASVIVLLLVLLGGFMLVTQTSLRTMASQTGGFVNAIAIPLVRLARRGLENITTLSRDRDETKEMERQWREQQEVGVYDDEQASNLTGNPAIDASDVPGEALGVAVASAALYDFEADGDDFGVADEAKPKRKRVTKPRASTSAKAGKLAAGGEQVGDWNLPPVKLLKQPGQQKIDIKAIEQRGMTLQESLASHNVETALVGMTVGPTVTRYELELGHGVKVSRVTNLQKDIAYALAATDVRILAPIPGKSAIGVEVPNYQRQLVALGDLLASPEALQATDPLEVAVGKDIAGKTVMLDLATTPHMLIAGATGAGKSSGINCIITSLLMRTTPEDVRLILIDPKQVEMGQYQRLPHLLTQPVTNPKKAANALGWAVKEMERRYDVLSEVGYRDITGYNKAFLAGKIEQPPGHDPDASPAYEHMPYIVVVVDELNDLMMVAARDVEESITRIAQKARAVGIHLIIATQRPSVNVITGVIKANIPARMAFAVSSLTDSRVILDQPGADKLVGKGDMLLLPGNSSVANRIQGAFITEDEVRDVVSHWRAQAPEPITSAEIEAEPGEGRGVTTPALTPPTGGGAPARPTGSLDASTLDVTSDANAFSAGGDDDEDAAMMRQAMELVVRSQLGSTSMLQRKLKVGFARAGRIMDLLEQRGVVGPSEGSKARSVLMTVEEFELLQQSGQI